MLAIKRILCPVDLSPDSRAALEYAVHFAELFDAELHVLHAYWQAPEYTGIDLTSLVVVGSGNLALGEVERRAAEHQLADFVAPHASRALRLQRHLALGSAPRAILSAAADLGCDLVVMGTHGRTGVRRLVLGSVAERVVRSSPCPVLVVREDRQPRLDNVLVPVDFSDHSTNAARYAIRLASRANPAIELLHVWDIPPHMRSVAIAERAGGAPVPLWELTRGRVQAAMSELVAKLDAEINAAMDERHGLLLRQRIEIGSTAETITDIAAMSGHDLIVLGTHGRTGLSRLAMGSVASKVVRTAACPVLVVPPTLGTSA
jgi:nucleotide-binding universal stress UspA family protein